MKTIRTIITALAVTTALSLQLNTAANAADDLQPIFTGTNFTGWKVPEPNPFWKITDGVLVGGRWRAK